MEWRNGTQQNYDFGSGDMLVLVVNDDNALHCIAMKPLLDYISY